jgi:hypothetical protein
MVLRNGAIEERLSGFDWSQSVSDQRWSGFDLEQSVTDQRKQQSIAHGFGQTTGKNGTAFDTDFTNSHEAKPKPCRGERY